MTSDQFVIKSDKEPLLPRATMKGLLVFIVVIAAVAAGPVHKVRWFINDQSVLISLLICGYLIFAME